MLSHWLTLAQELSVFLFFWLLTFCIYLLGYHGMFFVSDVFISAATRIIFYKLKSGASDIAQFVRFILVYVCEFFTCVYICVPHVCLVLAEVRRGCWIAWKWSYY